MHVNDATNGDGALSNEDGAQNTETPKKSEKKCRILCNPSKLPKSKVPPARVPKDEEMDFETKYSVKNYFADQRRKAIKKARERKWIR